MAAIGFVLTVTNQHMGRYQIIVGEAVCYTESIKEAREYRDIGRQMGYTVDIFDTTGYCWVV